MMLLPTTLEQQLLPSSEKGYEEAWIERQLAHAESNKTKASYDHSQHLDARRKMMQDWADIVDSWKD